MWDSDTCWDFVSSSSSRSGKLPRNSLCIRTRSSFVLVFFPAKAMSIKFESPKSELSF